MKTMPLPGAGLGYEMKEKLTQSTISENAFYHKWDKEKIKISIRPVFQQTRNTVRLSRNE